MCWKDACHSITGISHTVIDVNDNNACTIDGCNSLTGIFHTDVNINDVDECTIDACNTSTGEITHTSVNIDDGNVCTNDACEKTTGFISHTIINFEDDNPCTLDFCNSITGVTHPPVEIDDNNLCTADACNTITGEITHLLLNVDDENQCTNDGCNPLEGIYHNPVNVDDGNNCTIDACDSSSGFVSHTDNTPVVNATAGTIACYGGTTCITVDATGGQSPYNGTGVLCGYGEGTYQIIITDANGCNATGSVSLTQPEKLTLGVTTTNSIAGLPNGTATATPTGGTPPYSILWDQSGETTNTITNLYPGSYSVICTDANGCTATAIASVPIEDPNPQSPGPINGPAGACLKQTGIVYCVTLNDPYATSWIWTLPAGVTAIGPVNGPCITVKFTSKFRGGFICAKAVTPLGTSTNACLNVLYLNSKPNTPGIISGPSTVCPNANTTYSIAPVPKASSYEWTTSGNIQILSGQGTTSVTVKALSNFNGGSVKVRAINCKGNSGKKSKNISKTANCRLINDNVTQPSNTTIEGIEAMSVFPNPTSGKMTVTFNSQSKANGVIRLSDLLGNIVLFDPIEIKEGVNLKLMNLENLSKGIYLLDLKMENDISKVLRVIVN